MADKIKKLRILIVENSELALKISCMMLAEIGCTPDRAASGEEALILVAANDYDVIFMDIGLPKISGIEATIEIRRLEKEKNKKRACIALTAFSDDQEIKEKCLLAGMDFFKAKPINADQLREFFLQLKIQCS